MKLYHGGKCIVDHPIAFGSNKQNDYGPAFYLTRDINSAHEWACRNNSVGYVNEYVLNTNGLRILDLTDSLHFSVLNWLAILMHFRALDNGFIKSFSSRLSFLEENYYIDVTKYDLVIGYRADDAYFRFPLDFIRGNITLEQLSESFKLGNLGVQYVVVSEKGMKHLKFKKVFLSSEEYINKYFDTVMKATNKFDSLSKDEDGERIIDLMRNKK